MHNAPAVSAKALRCHAVLPWLLVVGCASIAAAVVAGQSSGITTTSFALPAVSCLVFVASVYGWWSSPVGLLSWDGRHWTWSGFAEDPECNPAIHLDFQWCVLLRLRNSRGASAWIFLQHNNNSAVWAPLRRALLAGSDDTA